MRHLDLFSGIGAMSAGMQRAGIETIAFVENNPYCRQVLEARWPDVPIHEDIREFDGRSVGHVDIVSGGFPCQTVSFAGKRLGENDDRWMWPDMLRVVGEARPRWVLVENVVGLLSADSGRLMGRVLGELAALGFCCRWDCIPAAAVGAPHIRDRVWILAHHHPTLRQQCRWCRGESGKSTTLSPLHGEEQLVADGDEGRREGFWESQPRGIERTCWCELDGRRALRELIDEARGQGWPVEPDMDRVVPWTSESVDRLEALGNSLVPPIAEIYGRVISAAA